MKVEAGGPLAVEVEQGAERVARRTRVPLLMPVALREESRDQHLLSREGSLFDGVDVPDCPRDSWRRRGLAAGDMVAIAAAWLVMWFVSNPPVELSDRVGLVLALPLWVVFHKLLGLYDRDDKVMNRSTLDELPQLLQSLTLGTLLIFMTAPMVSGMELRREGTILFWALCLISVPAARGMVRYAVRRHFAPERVMVVGTGPIASMVARKVNAHPEYGTQLIGFVDEGDGDSAGAGPARHLGTIRDFRRICARHEVERVIVAVHSLSSEETLDVIRSCKRASIKISVVPRLYEVIGNQVVVDEVEGTTLLGIRGLTRSRSSLALKRALDVSGAAFGLIVLSPLLAAIAIAVKLSSAGPVLYRQERMGRRGPFQMCKFRTMVDGADAMKPQLRHLNEAGQVMFKISEDPRVTRVGRFLRRTSLDELPQFWNVLRGEMSLVGPRPLVLDEDCHVLGWHRDRLELTPGLTGPWQVAGRTAIPFEEMVKMDYLYVAEWSLWNDLRLLLHTAPVVLLGKGA